MNHSFQQISALTIALLAFALAEEAGGNGFIAAFAAGQTLGNACKSICDCLYEFAEAEGQLLMLLTFLVFGAADVVPAFEQFTLACIGYSVLSLTAIRMLPISVRLLGAVPGASAGPGDPAATSGRDERVNMIAIHLLGARAT